MMMSAVGTRGELLGSRATGGFALAFKADALWVGAASDLVEGPAGRLNASEAAVTRVRTALEGSRGFTLGGRRLSLRPSVEVGVRRDGGDTETGASMDVGGGLAFSDTVTGLSLDVRMRTLVVHQAEAFSERGLSLSFGWDATPSSPLGLTAQVAPSWGGSAQSGAEALWSSQTAYGMGSHQMYGSTMRSGTRGLFPVVAEQHAHDAQPYLVPHGLVGGCAVAPCPRWAPRQEERAVVRGFEDAALGEPGQRTLTNGLAPLGLAPHPRIRIVCLRRPCDVGQGGIEQVVVQGRGIDQHQALEVGVDALFQRQVHQNGAGEEDVQPFRRE